MRAIKKTWDTHTVITVFNDDGTVQSQTQFHADDPNAERVYKLISEVLSANIDTMPETPCEDR